MPTKMPSFWASSRLQRMRVGVGNGMIRLMTFMSTASPVSFGMKSGRPALHRMRLEGRDGRRRRTVGVALLRRRRCRASARRRGSQTTILVSGRSLASTRATPLSVPPVPIAGDPVVEPLAGEIVDDLARGGARMHVGIGLVLELARQEPAVGLGEFDRLVRPCPAALAPPASAPPWRRESASAGAARR